VAGNQDPQEGDALYNADNSGSGAASKDTKDAGRMVVAVDAQGDGGARAGWPRRGTVEFDNVWMKYLPSAPYALKGESSDVRCYRAAIGTVLGYLTVCFACHQSD
jgi:hypothetical protein